MRTASVLSRRPPPLIVQIATRPTIKPAITIGPGISPWATSNSAGQAAAPTAAIGDTTAMVLRANPVYRATTAPAPHTPASDPHRMASPSRWPPNRGLRAATVNTPAVWFASTTPMTRPCREARPPRKSPDPERAAAASARSIGTARHGRRAGLPAGCRGRDPHRRAVAPTDSIQESVCGPTTAQSYCSTDERTADAASLAADGSAATAATRSTSWPGVR